jgi:hypothetical protein
MLIMIGLGVAALTLATLAVRRNLQVLRAQYGYLVPYSLATVLAALIAGLGNLGLLAVAFRQ